MEIKKRVKWKVVLYTLIGLVFLFLTFTVDWMFIAGAALVVYLNQKEIMKG